MRVGVNLLTCNLAEFPLHFRAAQYAVRSLLESDLQAHEWRLAIVDNGSTCKTTLKWLSELEHGDRRVEVNRQGINTGIARGRNLGYLMLGRWGCDVAVEVHTDHFFPGQWLGELLQFFEPGRFEGLGVLGPSLVLSPHSSGWGVGRVDVGYDGFTYEEFKQHVERASYIWRRPGTLRPGLTHPAVKRWTMLEEVGFYDGNLPGLQNFEDTEEALRIHQAGWQVMVNLASVVYHHYFFSRGDVGYHPHEYDLNNAYVQAKHPPGKYWCQRCKTEAWPEGGAEPACPECRSGMRPKMSWAEWNGVVGQWMSRLYR